MRHRAPLPDEGIIPLKPEDPEPLDGDLYDGEVYEEPSAARRWLVRLAWVGALAGFGAVAATTWQSWLPKAEAFGVGLVEKIDKRVNPPSPPPPSPEEVERKEREQALAAATESLPHVAPESLDLLMSASISVLEPPEVFRRAQDAVDRGRSLLPPPEGQELAALQEAAIATLPPAEQKLLRIYEDVRRARVTLRYEDRDGLVLLARGARALPPASLERLRVLSAKAIAAAPASPAPVPAAAEAPSPAPAS
jgi:hypothetical protein